MLKSRFLATQFFKLAFAAVLALAFVAAQPSSTAQAKPKIAKYGTIKILTTPGGFPVSIDGKAYGETSLHYRSFDLDPGLHTVMIFLPNGQRWMREIDLPAGRIKCVALNYRPSPPPSKSPCPYPVIISAPVTVSEGEIITYTSDVSYSGDSTLNYTWSVIPASAHIVSGAGTPTITVDSTGFAGQTITATLIVDDGSGDELCRQSGQASTKVPPQEKRIIVGREFDTCCSCSYDDQKARLDNLAVELQNDPTTRTYIFAYGGRTSPAGEADRLLARARDYLVTQRGIDASRVTMENGGFREEDCVEVWIVPQGAPPPTPIPTVQPGDVRYSPTPGTRRRNRR